jgi:cold shock protein
VVQHPEGVWVYPADDGSADVFVHISAVERSGIGYLNEGQKIGYEVEKGRNGKSSAVGLKAQ